MGDCSSAWYNAVLRADINRILVGDHSNIQDNAVLHLADAYACRVGSWVTIGHSAVIHACTIADEALVGMGAIVLDGAEIGPRSLVGAGTLVPQGFRVPEGSLVLGRPGRVVRSLTRQERADFKRLARKYVQLAREYLRLGL
jgi:carbonic anhydrase/acetyltransferase-like protein (isoleucine patch superfamily)